MSGIKWEKICTIIFFEIRRTESNPKYYEISKFLKCRIFINEMKTRLYNFISYLYELIFKF